MANLLSQNIGTNYKSILNLDATTINTPLDATLRAVTDGMGTASPLQLSTEQVGLSRTVALSAGATNPRLFNEVYTINNSGAQTGTLTGFFLNATETALNGITHNLMDLQVGGVSRFKVDNGGILSVGGTSGADGKILFRRSSDGTSTALIATTGSVFYLRESQGAGGQLETYDGTVVMRWVGVGSSARLQLGGTTSSFPSIKRNGAAIDFRLADDSGFCGINAGATTIKGSGTTSATTSLLVQNSAGTAALTVFDDRTAMFSKEVGFNTTSVSNNTVTIQALSANADVLRLNNSVGTLVAEYFIDGSNNGEMYVRNSAGTTKVLLTSSGGTSYFTNALTVGSSSANASSILQADSTTKGFLPPRMTTAQVNAIVTPAEGLVVFNTTISHLCVYQAAAWVKLSHTPM